jgi:Domain of unknown function (DUF4956)/3-keto-disaccharide hydrolase
MTHIPRCHVVRPAVRALVACMGTLVVLGLLVVPGFSQDDGWQENFDSAALQGWELGPDVAVADGALLIGPGNFAARGGLASDFRLSLQTRWSEGGGLRIVYRAREESSYELQVVGESIRLERRAGGPTVALVEGPGLSLASGEWQEVVLEVVGGSHRVSVNGQEVLSAEDPSPLRGGGVVFINTGSAEVAIDSLIYAPQMGEAPPPGEAPTEPSPGPDQGQIAPPAAPTPTPAPSSGLSGLVAQLSGQQADPLQLATIAVNLALAALFALILGQAYVHWGASLSNRRAFAANFMLITVTTTFIILVVRSSVALSLGLVGALSIVRFRAAIKEPEELAYLFFAIGLGIGLGDNQRLLTTVALIAGLILIGLLHLFRHGQADVNLHLTVASDGPTHVDLDSVLATLKAHCTKVKLMRFDETGSRMETSFLVELKRLNDLQAARDALRQLSPALEITFLDNRGIG